MFLKESKNKKFQETDCCEFVLSINDTFEDKINCKVYMNNNIIPNEVCSEFFIPYNDLCGIIISGTGKQVLVKQLKCSCYDKTFNNNEINSCDCCVVF